MTHAGVSRAPAEDSDALVIGSNLAALVLAYLLNRYGYRTRVVDRASSVGGTDRSFANRNGRIFDFGFHGLAYMRSEFVTRLFRSVIDDAVNHVEHRRGMVIRGYQIPYNARPEAWPGEISSLFSAAPLVDRLADDAPTRERLAAVYGVPFADLVFDEVLASYPSETRHRAFDVPDEKLLANIYPWFFPRVPREGIPDDPSRHYQDRVREGREESLLYPKTGGFGAFAQAFHKKLRAAGVEFVLGAEDLAFEVDKARFGLSCVHAASRTFCSPRVYWCASPTELCTLFDRPLPALDPDWFVLGSFEFDRPLRCDYTELIVGDPEHWINRVSFPGKLALERDDRVQLEFAFPRALSRFPEKAEDWLPQWTRSLRRLGIVDPDHRVVDFDFKRVPLLYNSYGVEGVPMPEVDLPESPPESNLRPVLPTLRKVNINTRVPEYLRFLAEDLTR